MLQRLSPLRLLFVFLWAAVPGWQIQAVADAGGAPSKLESLIRHPNPDYARARHDLLQAGPEGVAWLREQLGAEDHRTTRNAVNLLCLGFRFDRTEASAAFVAQVLPAILPLLESDRPAQRTYAAFRVGLLGPWAEPCLPALVGLIENDESQSGDFAAGRTFALHALGQIGRRSDLCLPVIERALAKPDLRPAAIQAIGRFEGRAIKFRPMLEDLVSQGDEEIRKRAREALERLNLKPRPEAGDPAPGFSLPSLDQQTTFTLADFRGTWLYLDMWSTTCPPCMAPLDQLQQWLAKGPGTSFADLRFLAVSLDEKADPARQWTERRGWSAFPHAWAGPDNKFMEDFRVGGLPDALLIDPQGRIVWRGNPHGMDLKAKIRGYRSAPAPGSSSSERAGE